MNAAIEKILGPRVPAEELRRRTGRYLLPTVLLLVAGALLGVSYTQPYWAMKLEAPQYPKGLRVRAYLDRLTGDVKEIDGLNHYIGMRPLNDAAQFERQTSWMMILVVVGLLLAAMFIHSRWAALAALPALLFPVGFLADLQYWLASFGTNLDPRAALSSSIKPFVPPVLGVGVIGQFKTVAVAGPGLWLATAAALVVLAALFFHRRAYKPLADRRRAVGADAGPALAIAAFAVLLAWSSAARADDAATPADDLNARIAQATAGETLRVPAGVYRGPVVVNKPIRLIAAGEAVIDAGGAGDTVRVAAPDVTLRGFHIRGTGDSLDQQNTGIAVAAPRAIIEDNTLDDVLLGISLSGAPDSVVRNNRIHGKPLDASRRGDGIRLWSSDRVTVEGNTVMGVRDVVVWYSKGVRLTGNSVRDSRYGLHFMYANDGVVENNHLHENSVGVFLMYSRDVLLKNNRLERNRGPSGYGIGLKDMDGVSAEGNLIVGNRVGLYMDNSPSRMDVVQEFRRNVFALNDVGLAFLPAVRRNRFIENEFSENLEQIAILGGGELRDNDFTVAGRGNYWSDYAGFDANGDGVGDVPYRAMSLFESWIDREPNLRLFLYSPAQQAVEFAGRAFPIVRPQAKITDTAPLMRPPAVAQYAAAAMSWPQSAGGAGVLALLALAYGVLRRRWTDGGRRASPSRIAGECDAGATQDAAILAIRGLSKNFGWQTAVDGLSLRIAPGQALALWGTNGAGKTTILKCILGLYRCAGEIRVGPHDARRDGPAARRLIGYVSQEQGFYDDLSALETVRLFAALKRVPRARAAAALAQVELSAHAHKRVAQLSGGMKQRLALAVALLSDPPILLLDEPTSNLDAAARRAFFGLLHEVKRAGKTILFTTHRAEEIAGLADRVVVLERGRVIRDVSAGKFDVACTLRILLPAERHEPAERLLTRAGFAVRRNCRALLVRVPAAQNAVPLAHLARAGFEIQTFEIESGEHS